MNPALMGMSMDPLQAYAAMAQGQMPQAQPEVADPLTRALEYARAQQAQLGPAPQMDPSILSDMEAAQRQQQMADALMNQGYVPNSGALGALAQIASAWKGGKMADEAGESLSQAYARQMQAENEAARYADQQKGLQGSLEMLQRMEQGQAFGLSGDALQEYALTGKMSRGPSPTSKERDFERAQRDPAYAAWLEKNAPKGTSVNVTLPPGQKAFDVELGKQDAQTYVGWRDNAVNAQKTLQQLGNVEEILSLQQTGKVQEALALAGQYFGTEAGASLQSLKGAIQPIVLSQVKQLGSGNGITDADRKFIEAGMPGFGNDPRANERVTRIMRQSAQANITLYDEADKHLEANGSLRGFRPSVNPAGGTGGGDAPSEGAPKRLKYNPETGELE